MGTVVGWWAGSLAAWPRPSRRAVFGVVTGAVAAAGVVALVAGPARLPAFALGTAVGATAEIALLAGVAGRTSRNGLP
ncbi:hypothetical protein [Micromonospora sp. WMMD975]|uniref:hypothetical protein n=1 Tax=Micromonospora sp. WMMD975 TaxID=3016087 RepID=UPI00249CC119|nr:hypothetical protein [Micromonospora sp. WMMD975]WFE31242.1 hypothetical protein O7613_16540 [Micromonospora sp. WMMD975]